VISVRRLVEREAGAIVGTVFGPWFGSVIINGSGRAMASAAYGFLRSYSITRQADDKVDRWVEELSHDGLFNDSVQTVEVVESDREGKEAA